MLVLVRHGQSEWNAKNLFTGWRDPPLSAQGEAEAKAAGKALKNKNITFARAFTSALGRAQRTCEIILAEMGQAACPTQRDRALNERDYGALSGLNKDEARERFGAEQVHQWRRSYETRPPEGESLADTAQRVLPYFKQKIKPIWQNGQQDDKHILVAAHGNSLRALIMFLENLSPDEIIKKEIATGEPLFYTYDEEGVMKRA